MSSLRERIAWVLMLNRDGDPGLTADTLLREIEKTHRVVDPDVVTEEMLDACFGALPKNYDPPDPKRRPWHGYKAKHRYTAMVKASPPAK